MSKRTISYIVVLCGLLAIAGCGKKNRLPQSGDLYFKTMADGLPEYIHMKFDRDSVSGEIFMRGDRDDVYYPFEGKVESDSILHIRLINTIGAIDSREERWTYRLESNKLYLTHHLGRTETRVYESIDAAGMPDASTYFTEEEIALDMSGEFWENLFLGCYVSPSLPADSANPSPLREFIRFNPRSLSGTGFGTQGDARWHFGFDGTMQNDSVWEMQVTYRQAGKADRTTSETWIFDESTGRIRLGSDVSGRPGSRIYERAELPDEMYFESTPPHAMKKNPLYEYLSLSYKDSLVWGAGAGDFMEGSEPWTLLFDGAFIDKNTMKLRIDYTPKRGIPFTETGVWTLDAKNKRLYRNDWAKSNHTMGAAEYHGIDADDIPSDYAAWIMTGVRR